MTDNPFILEAPALICFSTGRTSGYMLYKILDAYNGILPEGIIVSFQNTGKEREESLQFGHEIETRWSVPIVWLEWDDVFRSENYLTKNGQVSYRRKNMLPFEGFKIVDFHSASRKGEPYDNMIDYYNQYRILVSKGSILPNPVSRMCTAYLKIKTSNRYMKSMGYSEYDCALGIRKDEPKRYSAMMKENDRNSNSYFNVCPLYDAGITKSQIMEFWSNQPFNLQLDPQSDEGNCDLCFLKRADKIINIMKKTDRFDKFWIEAEERTGETFRRDRPSYSELRRMITEDDPKLLKILARAPKEQQIDCICGAPD
jgi:3'-phosphoadenosine 5'-phosphosulfate sulfotransferase (PAPS reductase)/FAD synthetase